MSWIAKLLLYYFYCYYYCAVYDTWLLGRHDAKISPLKAFSAAISENLHQNITWVFITLTIF